MKTSAVSSDGVSMSAGEKNSFHEPVHESNHQLMYSCIVIHCLFFMCILTIYSIYIYIVIIYSGGFGVLPHPFRPDSGKYMKIRHTTFN